MSQTSHSPHINHITQHINRTYKILKKFRMTRSNINILITIVAIVMIRRGVRGFLDIILFPNHQILSLISSIVLGVAILWIDNKELDEL